MSVKVQVEEIILALQVLPPEKVAEVQDFVLFLKDRYGQKEIIDESDSWSEEDLRDFAAASWEYAEKTVPWDESLPSDSTQESGASS